MGQRAGQVETCPLTGVTHMIGQELADPLPRPREQGPSPRVPRDPDVDRGTDHDLDAGTQLRQCVASAAGGTGSEDGDGDQQRTGPGREVGGLRPSMRHVPGAALGLGEDPEDAAADRMSAAVRSAARSAARCSIGICPVPRSNRSSGGANRSASARTWTGRGDAAASTRPSRKPVWLHARITGPSKGTRWAPSTCTRQARAASAARLRPVAARAVDGTEPTVTRMSALGRARRRRR